MKENKEENKEEEQQPHGFDSNPEKSFEAGAKGGDIKATPLTTQATNTTQPHTGPPHSLGANHSRIGTQNKPTQGAGWQSRKAGSEEAGKKDPPADAD